MVTSGQPKTLQQAILYFSDYQNCYDAMVALRWPSGTVACPTCGSTKVTYLENARVWKCYEKHPKAKFSLKVGTIFEDSPIPLQKWFPALWMIVNCKNGISSYELGRALGVTQKSAWFMLSRLRLAMQDKYTGGKLSGHAELDETYIGGKARNMHYGKRKRLGVTQGKSIAGKVAVMGLLEGTSEKGSSRVRVAQVRSTKRDLMPHVRKHVTTGGRNDRSRFYEALQGLLGRSLTFTALIGSEEPQTC